MKTLELAIQIAVNAHLGQVDKAGAPYILHPLRLMHNVSSVHEKIVAVLHDAVEDTDITLSYLDSIGIPTKCIEALELLSRPKDQDYIDYIQQLSSNPLAKSVKLADLTDNTNMKRFQTITPTDRERFEKYTNAISYLNTL